VRSDFHRCMQQRWCSGHAEQQRQIEEECVLTQGQLEHLKFPGCCQISFSALARLAFDKLKGQQCIIEQAETNVEPFDVFRRIFDDSSSATVLDVTNATAAIKSATNSAQGIGRRNSACQSEVGTETCLATLKD